MVLSDFLVADPRVLRDLHEARIPHLPVRVRDGTGLVGPLVIPGRDQLPGLRRSATAATATRRGPPSPPSCATRSAARTGPPCSAPPRWR